MGDYDFSQDPVEAAARKFGAFWEHLKRTYFEATRGERLTVWTNLLLVIVGVTAAVIYFFQLQATRSQLTVMQNQLESADRPWLKITGAMPAAPLFYHVPYVLTPGLDFVNTGIKVTVENVGHSVALDITTRAQMVLVKPLNGAANDYFSYPLRMQKKLCSEAAPPGLPINLFPGENNNDQSGDDEDFPIAGKTFTLPNDPSGPKIDLIFVGCVDYRISASGKMHHSNFIYELKVNDPGQRDDHGILTVGKIVPVTDLRLEKWAFGGFDAN
jgi:hypothetical protein